MIAAAIAVRLNLVFINNYMLRGDPSPEDKGKTLVFNAYLLQVICTAPIENNRALAEAQNLTLQLC